MYTTRETAQGGWDGDVLFCILFFPPLTVRQHISRSGLDRLHSHLMLVYDRFLTVHGLPYCRSFKADRSIPDRV